MYPQILRKIHYFKLYGMLVESKEKLHDKKEIRR